jgi:hypothetical protein
MWLSNHQERQATKSANGSDDCSWMWSFTPRQLSDARHNWAATDRQHCADRYSLALHCSKKEDLKCRHRGSRHK